MIKNVDLEKYQIGETFMFELMKSALEEPITLRLTRTGEASFSVLLDRSQFDNIELKRQLIADVVDK